MEYNLGSVITNPVARRVIYGLYVVAGILFGAASVGYATVGDGVTPEWVSVGLAVLGYLSIPVGGLALSNVGSKAEDVAEIIVDAEEVQGP